MICERLLKEREEKVREEYEETMTSKLAGGVRPNNNNEVAYSPLRSTLITGCSFYLRTIRHLREVHT